MMVVLSEKPSFGVSFLAITIEVQLDVNSFTKSCMCVLCFYVCIFIYFEYVCVRIREPF